HLSERAWRAVPRHHTVLRRGRRARPIQYRDTRLLRLRPPPDTETRAASTDEELILTSHPTRTRVPSGGLALRRMHRRNPARMSGMRVGTRLWRMIRRSISTPTFIPWSTKGPGTTVRPLHPR